MIDNVKSHPVYSEYGCDENGNVYSCRKGCWKLLALVSINGYYGFTICYAAENIKFRKMVHRFVYECYEGVIPENKEIDHIDRCPINNRRKNIRLSTKIENHHNTSKKMKMSSSKYKGVCYERRRKRDKWVASITSNYITKKLGRFDDEISAALAYDEAAKAAGIQQTKSLGCYKNYLWRRFLLSPSRLRDIFPTF